MCTDCPVNTNTHTDNGMGFVVKQYKRANCGQHWIWDGSWKAVTRIRWIGEKEAEDKAKAEYDKKQIASTLGPNVADNIDWLEYQRHAKDLAQTGQMAKRLTRREAERSYFCPWQADWPNGHPYRITRDYSADLYIVDWDSPYDALNGKPTHLYVILTGLDWVQLGARMPVNGQYA